MERNKHILMFHTGEFAQIDSVKSWQNPAEYTVLAEGFPTLKIILSHGGKKKYSKESFEMMKKYNNVFIDTGFVSPQLLLEMYPRIDEVIDKILFASDMPGGVSSLNGYIKGFRDGCSVNSKYKTLKLVTKFPEQYMRTHKVVNCYC